MEKKRILTRNVVPGMIIADDIYTDNHQMVIEEGTELTDYIITRLKFYSIDSIRIYEGEDLEFVPLEDFAEQIKQSKEYQNFHTDFDTSVAMLNNTLHSFADNKMIPMNISNMNTWINSTLDNSRNGMHLFHMLHCMRDNDDETYAHSLNVAMICNAIGTWLKFSEEDLTQLTLAGLLHDVGKVFLPIELLKKEEALTDEELETLRSHTIVGYNSLKRQPVDTRVRYAAMMHHERCDGSGYPNHFSAGQIDDFAKIVAIADTYDAMTSPRIYRKALCPFEAVHLFQTEGLCLYDPKYLMVFLEGIIDCFLHNRVRLSNGLEGEIVLINKSDLSKPMVKVGEDNFINLFKEHDLTITDVLT